LEDIAPRGVLFVHPVTGCFLLPPARSYINPASVQEHTPPFWDHYLLPSRTCGEHAPCSHKGLHLLSSHKYHMHHSHLSAAFPESVQGTHPVLLYPVLSGSQNIQAFPAEHNRPSDTPYVLNRVCL